METLLIPSWLDFWADSRLLHKQQLAREAIQARKAMLDRIGDGLLKAYPTKPPAYLRRVK